ncbi:hypothetical protein BU15DRAFT_66463 [Melanogaster broomeanus]|nr:hypothetical protein BU15DRAFT_66463 [Melanogaster broomeanus]
MQHKPPEPKREDDDDDDDDDDDEGGKRTRTPPRNSTHGTGRRTRDERREGVRTSADPVYWQMSLFGSRVPRSLLPWPMAPCPSTLHNCSSSPSVPSVLSLDTGTAQPLASPMACGSLPKHPAQLLVVLRSLLPWPVTPCPSTLRNYSSSPSVTSVLSLDTGTAQPLASPVACGSLPKHPAQLLVVPSSQPRHPCRTTAIRMLLMPGCCVLGSDIPRDTILVPDITVNCIYKLCEVMDGSVVRMSCNEIEDWFDQQTSLFFILIIKCPNHAKELAGLSMRNVLAENVDRIGLALAETVAQANNGPGQGDNPPLISHPYMYCSVPSMSSHGLT